MLREAAIHEFGCQPTSMTEAAQAHPRLTAVVLDLPSVVVVAREYIARHDLGRAHTVAECLGYLRAAGFLDVAATEFVRDTLTRVSGRKPG